MKKILLSVIVLSAFLVINSTTAQEKDCCKKPGTMTCPDKVGSSQGEKMDSLSKVCPVSGETIEEGKGKEFSYLGTKYTFCCEHCVGKFKAEPMNYIKTELTCPVMGDAASKDFSVVNSGTKYYFCCESCLGKFEKNPEKYLNKFKDKE
jgi:YHS domain-containing protein